MDNGNSISLLKLVASNIEPMVNDSFWMIQINSCTDSQVRKYVTSLANKV